MEDWNEIASQMDAAEQVQNEAHRLRSIEIAAKERARLDEENRKLEKLLVPARHFLQLMANAGNPGATIDMQGLEESRCKGWTTAERIRVSVGTVHPRVELLFVRIGVLYPHLWQCPSRTDHRWLWYSLRDYDLNGIPPEWLTQQCIKILRRHDVPLS